MTLDRLLKEHLRLSLYEAKAYLCLLKGAMAPKEVSRLSSVPLPRVYDVLESLQGKGFVAQEGDLYAPIRPEVALEGRRLQLRRVRLEEEARRAENITRLIESLKGVARAPIDRSGRIQVFRGINGISNIFHEVMIESKDVMLCGRKSLQAKEFFIPIMERVVGQGRRVRLLIPEDVQLEREDEDVAAKLGIEIRTSKSLLLDMMVADEGVVMIGVPDPLSDEPYHSIAILVENASFASSVRTILEDFWARSGS